MAVTWAASAPHGTAVKEVQKAGIGSGYGLSGASTYEVLKWPGNKRAVLTKLTATGTYTTGGDAITPATFGLREVQAAFVVSSPTTNVVSTNKGNAVLTVDCGTTTSPKVKLVANGSDVSAATTVTDYVAHVILVGV